MLEKKLFSEENINLNWRENGIESEVIWFGSNRWTVDDWFREEM